MIDAGSEPALVPLLLTEPQVAALLGVSTRTVRRLASAGLLRKVPIGTRIDPAAGNKPGPKPRVRFRRREVLQLAEKGWTWE